MNQYFQKALSDFTFDAACGGAIRHLAGLGYTAKEIHERLSFPVPLERVRQAYTKYLLEEGILLKEKPEPYAEHEKYIYVQEEGKYGRKSFRRVKVERQGRPPTYVACEFAIRARKNHFRDLNLTGKQQEYLDSICWDKSTMYHILNERMSGIVRRLGDGDGAKAGPAV